MKNGIKLISLIPAVLLILALSACSTNEGNKTGSGGMSAAGSQTGGATNRTIVDMRGKSVEIPVNIQRVAIIDKGFVVQCMTAMDVDDKIVASGGLVQTSMDARERDSLYLCPHILELPKLGYPTDAVDFEKLVGSKPEIVILRNSEYIKDSEITAEAIKKIEEDLKLPLIVVNGPGCYDEVKIETQYQGIRLIGEVFGKEERAEEIIALMQEPLELVMARTKDIAEEDKPVVMYIGGLTGEDVSGTVWGKNYGDAKFGEEIANIKNVHNVHEAVRKVSAEHIIAMNPDVIILCTVSPAPEVFLNDPLYASLRNVTAVKEKQVASLGLLTWWGDFRLEIPTIMLITAKNVYPDKFEDVNVGQWLNEYHRALYSLTEEQAQELKDTQNLEWMDSMGF